MARPSKTRSPADTDAIAQAAIDEHALAQAGEAAAQLSPQLASIDGQFAELPYNLDLYIATIRQRAVESAQRLLEIGRMLLVMREHEPQQAFAQALDRCGLSARFAQRAMQAAVKLADRPAMQSLGMSKALELLSEPDEALDALEAGGSIAGVRLDDIDRMTVRELRDTLRAERAERADAAAADAEIIAKKDARINTLLRERRTGKSGSARAKVDTLIRRLDEDAMEVATLVKAMRDTASAIYAAYNEAGEVVDEEVAGRIEQNGALAAEWARVLVDELGE
ncbi:MAG: hypothetical protein F9K31_06515 [Dokdonella sp.]|nr:MAG: hypothetical protein F9K31_06515 [Dokdonella sp.]